MILTADGILMALERGEIVIEPWNPKSLGANSYDVTLDQRLLVYETEILDPMAENPTAEISIPPEGLVLTPGELYLGGTVEKVGSDRYVTCLEGRSSLARLGISIHQTAGFGDLGFISRWTMELTAIRPVKIYAGMRIGQFAFHTVQGTISTLYSGKYGRGNQIEASRSFQDQEFNRDKA
jgi:dCTP deaminase